MNNESEETSDIPESLSTYLRLRGLKPSARMQRRKKRQQDSENLPFTSGRDPQGLGDVITSLTRQSGWEKNLARHDVVLQWDELAGEQTAQHARPVALGDGVLTIQCDSTAWMTELKRMRTHLTTMISQRFPDAGVETIRFVGPDVPSWKWGPRAVPGRGPRDTYG